MVNKIKDLWEELMIFHEQVVWQNSKARRELAVERITQLKAFTSGESDTNPYDEIGV